MCIYLLKSDKLNFLPNVSVVPAVAVLSVETESVQDHNCSAIRTNYNITEEIVLILVSVLLGLP